MLCLLWATACQGNAADEGNKRDTEEINKRDKPFRDLGWSEPYYSAEEIECVLVVKQKYWNDPVAHIFLRSVLIKDILGKDPLIRGIEDDMKSQETLYFGSWHHGIGRAFYVVQTEYHIVADLILDKLKDYLGAWLDAPLERRLIDKMMKLDGRTPPESSDSGSSPGGSLPSGYIPGKTSPRRFSTSSSWSGGSDAGEPYRDGRFLDIRYLTCPPKGTHGRDDSNWQKWWDLREAYYAGGQGQGVDVYVVDSGLSAAAGHHEAFASASHYRQVGSWMKTDGIDPEAISLADYDYLTYHGTDVVSKIVGSTTGLATKANVITAIFNPDGERNRNGHLYCEMLLNIRKAILEKRSNSIPSKAIISLSVSLDGHLRKDKDELKAYPFLKEIERGYFDLMSIYADAALDKVLELDNVIVVAGTGNDAVGRPILDWPAKRGTKEISNLVIAGQADEKGRLRGHVEAEYVKIYGVAESITVPYIRSNRASDVKPKREKYVEEAGVSLVVPMITGILASHMSDHPAWTPLQAVEKLYKDAYPYEKDSTIKMAWVGPRDKLGKRSDPSGGWPDSEDEVDGEDKGTGKDETDRKDKGTGKDETNWDDIIPGKDETDEEDKGDGKDKKIVERPKKPRCSHNTVDTEWRRLRRRKDWNKGKSGSGDIGFEDDDEYEPLEGDEPLDLGNEDCLEEEEGNPNPPAQPSYQSTITVAMHITSVAATPKPTPKSTRKVTPKPTTTKSPTKPIYTGGWDGTKHAATEMMSRPPPVKTFITPNPTPEVGDKGSMMAGAAGAPRQGFANPAPRPGGLQKPVLDRKSMLRASVNRFRGYTSTRRRAVTYTPEAKDNGAPATTIYTTVYGVTGSEILTFAASTMGKSVSITITSSDEPPVKTSTASKTPGRTTMKTSISMPSVK
ncbi:uncharacterized protein DFL_000345 [Arthrobotrys flagrans]|uniref:Peptidase S8/S53 domain-containing protein n=1 Tax=Arthrobotrys flagrans TaxID=97331 RepID=A0A437ADL6_ARTFL|nr:hypothetical protein DFL_000345 [Arthrobotrys flagrans]